MTKKLSKAQRTVLDWGAAKHKYAWVNVPGRSEWPGTPKEVRRAFGRPTLMRLVKMGYIRYQPARFYVTGKGRKALK